MKKTIFLVFIMLGLVFSMTAALAQDDGDQNTNEGPQGDSSSSINLPNPLKPVDSVPALIGNIINGVLGVVGSLALLMFIYGGFTWMLSGGSSTAVKRGKDILIWAAIGLVIIFISYALVNFVITTIT